MKKYLLSLLSLVAFLCCTQTAWAQPSVCVNQPFVEVSDTGTEFCVQFTVNDFTDITSMYFDVLFDEDIISYTSHNVINSPGITMLDNSDVIVTDAADGLLRFEWDGLGTLDDGTALFEVCFTSEDIGFSYIDVIGDKVTRTISGNFNIGFDFIKDGFVSVGPEPLILTIPTVSGLQGQTACLNITADNFTQMLAVQMSIHYDPDQLNLISFEGVEPMSGGSFNFAVPEPGTITVTWADNDGSNGVTIPDGSSFIQLCFELTGDCTSFNEVYIDDIPTITESVSVACAEASDGGANCGILTYPGGIIIDCIQPGAPSFCIPDISEICPGESFSMEVTTEDFDAIRRMDFSLNWNANVLQLDNIIETDNLPFFDIDANAAGGFATCTWQGGTFGNSLPDGTVIFTLNFTVVGGGGSSSAVSVTGNPTPIFFSDQAGPNAEHIGYNSCNGLFQACSPTGITVSASDEAADPGAPVCVEVTVQDFDDITELAFSMDWEPAVMEFVSVTDFNLPGLSAADFNLDGSAFGFACLDSWTSAEGVSLPDGSPIFSVCFEAENNPLACGELTFSNSPCGQVVMQEDIGFDIGMNSNPGSVCINNPNVFTSSGNTVGGSVGSFVCVDISVENFLNLSDMEYSLNWNTTVLDFLNVESSGNLENLSSGSFDVSDVENGNLTVDWEKAGAGGLNLADGTIIYSVCFQIIGDLAGCTPLSFTGSPAPINIINANNPANNIGMESNDGQVCPVQALNISADISDVNCTSAEVCDGAIDLTVTGGSGSYNYLWIGPGIDAGNSGNEDQTELCVGSYFVQVSDPSSNLQVEQTYIVETSENGPTANAGPDTTLNCGIFSLMLDVSDNGTSVGSQFSYLWETPAGSSTVIIDGENSLTPQIGGSNDFVYFSVTNEDTGCVVTDTLYINATVFPIADAGADADYDCLVEEITLDASESDTGDEFSVSWTAEDGGMLDPATANDYEATALSPGTYIITVLNSSNNCERQDTVLVNDIRTEPTAVAGVNGMIDCDNDSAELDGTGSDTGAFTYAWTTPNGVEVFMNPDALIAQTNVTGEHTLTVTDTSNGCTGTATVTVDMDMGIPTGSAGMNMDFFCNTENVTLQGEAPAEPGDYSYSWEGPAGASILDETTLSPTVDMPGGYFLTIVNDDTGCEAVFSVQVVANTDPPVADAGEDTEINCAVAEVTLDGTDSDDDMEYLWMNADGTDTGIVSGETGLTPVVNLPGTYVLTVTNPATQCTETAEVTVAEGAGVPVAEIAPTEEFFGCETDEIILDASASTAGANYEYTWIGECIDTTDPQSPVIGCAGTYTLTVTDTVLNCVSETVEITLLSDTEAPVIVTEEEVVIPCGQTEVMLDASDSSTGDNFMITWTAISGSVDDENSYTPNVTAGTYGVSLVNTDNQCETVSNVTVTENGVIAEAGMNAEIDCSGEGVQLDGSGSSEDGAIYAWTYEDGTTTGITDDNTLMPTVTLPGMYTLTVTDATGACTATDEVQVVGVPLPVADAGADVPLTCSDEFVTLDGSGSDAGEDITYEWTTAGGNFVSTDLTTITVDVDAVGDYLLTVLRADGCTATDTVRVFADAGDLPPATASVEHDICENTALVTGNLPEGTTGQWTSSNSAVNFLSPTEIESEVENIPGGEHLLIWTLSTAGCENYDADTVLVITEFTPTATDDFAEIAEGEETVTLDVLDNDQTGNVASFSFNLSEEPSVGTIIENIGDGVITYQPQLGVGGEVMFDYILCNTNCPDLCDEATVTITLNGEIDFDNFPNTITPNGDGLNDVLIFDVLNVREYPNSSLTVFNRYGDEVYEAKPYNNDWGGTYNGGLLPQATYYFVLRLDLGEGEAIKGDITILR